MTEWVINLSNWNPFVVEIINISSNKQFMTLDEIRDFFGVCDMKQKNYIHTNVTT